MNKLLSLSLILISWVLPSSSYSATQQNIDNLNRLIQSSDQIIGLEVLVAAGSDDAIYSRFGHAMLRFVKRDGNFATDSVLSFVADVGDDEISWSKGLDGEYPLLPLVQPLAEFWTRYVQEEKRPLERYIIVSNSSQRARLLSTLNEWAKNPERIGNYTFLSNNCAGALARLLEDAGLPHVGLILPKVPTHLNEWLNQSLLSPYPALEVENDSALFSAASQILKISPEDFQSGKNWPENSAKLLMNGLSDRDLKRLLLEVRTIPDEVQMQILELHNFVIGGATLEETLSFKSIPKNLYELCNSEACARELIASGQQVWTDTQWKEAIRNDDFAYWLIFRSQCDESANCSYHEDSSREPAVMQENIASMQYFLSSL